MKTLALFLSLLTFSSAAYAASYKDAHRLGGTTSFSHPALTGRQSVVAFVNKNEADIRTVLAQADIERAGDAVIKALRYGYLAPTVTDCNSALPADGSLIQCNFPAGSTLEWMAYRPNKRTPDLMRKIRWAGKKSFRAYLFNVSVGNKHYTFVLPKDCGNLALKSESETFIAEPLPPPVVVVPEVPQCQECPPPQIITIQGETVTKIVEVEKKRRLRLFAEGDFGKDRRVRNKEYGEGTFAQCTPLLAAKLGALYKFDNGWETGAAVGMTYPLVDSKTKAKQEEVFADLELNRYFGNFYVGGGLSFWDITRTKATRQGSYTPAILMHFGIPVAKRVAIVGEDRVFTRQLDDISNNYQFWLGARVKF